MIRSGTRKLSVASALLLAACGQEQQGHRFEAGNFGGVESQTFGLISTACTYSGTGNLDMNLVVNSGEVLYVYYRSTDGRVVASGVDANGVDCNTTTAGRIIDRRRHGRRPEGDHRLRQRSGRPVRDGHGDGSGRGHRPRRRRR